MMPTHRKLFIPGPVEVSQDTLAAIAKPMIGHREKAYAELHGRVVSKLRKILYTEADIFLVTSSATGMMEAVVRNLCARRTLTAVLGAFSDRWHEIALANGKPADRLEVEWGRAIKPELVDQALATGKYDLFCLVHNETSTGVMNPLDPIADVVRRYPDVLLAVDSVSSMTGVKIEVDKLGLDVCFAGVQKAYGLPPGLTVATVSKRALERAKTVESRGYYFDFVEMKDYADKNQTPCTPAISLIHGLDLQTDKMLAEGLDSRFARHQRMAERCRTWAIERGFALFPEKGYESVTLTCVANSRNIDVGKLNGELAKRGFTISDGYGRLKGKTFRIAHMADCQPAELDELLDHIDDVLKAQ